MAEVTIHSLVTSEKSESDAKSEKTSISKPSSPDNDCSILLRNHRASTNSFHDVNNSRRNSTGKPSFQNSNEKIVPHYLRASTGSCHDFCKYGKKHAFEEKEMRPCQKRIVRGPSDRQNPAVTVSLLERKKATVLKQMISPDVKRITRDPSDKQNPAVTVSWGERKKAIVQKQMISTAVRSHSLKHRNSPGAIKLADPPEIIKQEVLLPSKKVDVSPKQDELSDKKLNAEKRADNFSDKRSPSVQLPLRKQFSSFYTLESSKNAEKAEMMTNNLPQKCSPSVRPKPATSKSAKFFGTAEQINGRSKRKDDTKARKAMVPTKASAKKVLASPTASPKPSIKRNVALKAKKSRSLNPVSPLKDQNSTKEAEMEKAGNEKVPEKTLHVIVIETKNDISESTEDSDVTPSLAPQSFPSPKSLSQLQSPSLSFHEEGEGEDDDDDHVEEEEEEGELGDDDEIDDEEEEGEDNENRYAFEKADESISDKNGMTNINEVKAVEGNQRKTRRKGVVSSEPKDPIPVKLKFKRGKVVDLQSESNGPRRLRFRPARLMEENQDRKREIRRRNSKKKGPDDDGNGTQPSNEKVVLRHQDMEGRKDAQGLFNNVIEETASKLVESRKSKVKALVGAFETVISLQDTKPSSQTVN